MKTRRSFQQRDGLPDNGFRTFGEFLVAVHRADAGIEVDARLVRAATEGDPTAGGFAVPEVYATRVIGSIYEGAVLAPLCDVTEPSGPIADYKEPAFDESSRADGSRWGGALGYWLAEEKSVPATKPKFRMNEFVPHKLMLLAYVTNEMFADANMLEAHFERAMAAEGSFKLDAAIFSGTGAGVPLGILPAPATITVAKETGQAAASIIKENIDKMWSRMPLQSRRRAVWLVNEDAEAQISTADASIYLAQGVGGNPYPLLKGRPLLAIEQATPLGTLGDIVLADLQQYRVVQGTPQFAVSADLAFDTDESVFRFSLRVDGKPAYASAVTPYNGTGITRSPFVTLAAR